MSIIGNNTPLPTLLRRNVSSGQLLGYGLASLIGLSIVLVAMQFYRDVRRAWEDRDSMRGENYMVLSKQVNGLGGMLGNQANISAEELAGLSTQPWVEKVGIFTAADFDVLASIDTGTARMSTSLFLESVPDDFLDIHPAEWDEPYSPHRPLPVIIPKEYLALYNFGYAGAHGMPQLSESMMGMLPLRLSLSGNGLQESVSARIVGFSSRLNTIAVPENFLKEANRKFGLSTKNNSPSRVIVKVTDKGDPAIEPYLEAHSLEAAGDSSSYGKIGFFLSMITSVVVVIGAVITILSFFILLLSIYLLLQKNREKIHDLMLLGYGPGKISRIYATIVITINSCVFAVSIGVILIARMLWSSQLEAIGITPASPWLTIAVGAAIMVMLTTLDLIAISRRVKSNFRL